MKNRHKYRAWDKVNKRMLTYVEIYCYKDGSVGVYAGENNNQPLGRTDDFELIEFTGLVDRNGKEIYEGDVINARYAPSYIINTYEIKYGINGAAFSCYRKHPNPNVQFSILPLCPSNSMEDVEIIGNIFEHPHLLTPTP